MWGKEILVSLRFVINTREMYSIWVHPSRVCYLVIVVDSRNEIIYHECYSVAIVIRGPHNLDSIVMFKETLEVATTITSGVKIKCKYVKFIFTFQRKHGSIYL